MGCTHFRLNSSKNFVWKHILPRERMQCFRSPGSFEFSYTDGTKKTFALEQGSRGSDFEKRTYAVQNQPTTWNWFFIECLNGQANLLLVQFTSARRNIMASTPVGMSHLFPWSWGSSQNINGSVAILKMNIPGDEVALLLKHEAALKILLFLSGLSPAFL